MGQPIVAEHLRTLGYQKIDATSAAAGPSVAGLVNTPRIAYCVTTATGITWRDDGTDPTSVNGMPLINGELWYAGPIAALKFFGGVVHVTLYEA